MAKKSRNKRQFKNKAERDYYSRMIRELDFEPTKSESINFNDSDDNQEDYSLQNSPRQRRRPIGNVLSDHFRDNLGNYIVGLVLFLITFFMIDSKVDIATIKEKIFGLDEKTNRIESEIKEVENDVQKNKDEIHKQEIKIIENSYKSKNRVPDSIN